jgi:hypothetical protein
VSFAAPADAYSNSTVAIDIATGKLRWYYQELPGDDWDADHNQERLLMRLRVNPDPKHVKWIATDVPRNQERDVVVTVGEGGGLFVVERHGHLGYPFPYDNPDININDINLETGQTHINVDKLFKKDGQALIASQHARPVTSPIIRTRTRSTFRSDSLDDGSERKAKNGWGRAPAYASGTEQVRRAGSTSTGELNTHSQPQSGGVPPCPTATWG